MCWATPTRRYSGCSCKGGCMTITPSTRFGSPGCGRACGCSISGAGPVTCPLSPPGSSARRERVLGVDAAPEMVELARARAAEQGFSTVHFERAAIDAITLDEPVDAVVGRLILMHLPDPAATLRHLSSLVRPGGVIAFSENDITGTHSIPELPLFGPGDGGDRARLRGDGAQCAVWHHPAHGLSPTPVWVPHALPLARRSVPPPTATSWPTPRKSGGWYPRSLNSWASRSTSLPTSTTSCRCSAKRRLRSTPSSRCLR